MGEQGRGRWRHPPIQVVGEPCVDLNACDGFELGSHGAVDGIAGSKRRGIFGAPPVEVVATVAPVAAVPLTDGRGDAAVGGRLVLTAQWELPAHFGLEFYMANPPPLRFEMESAACAGGKSGAVEEDARIVDESRPKVAVVERHHNTIGSLGMELPKVWGHRQRNLFCSTSILCVGEMGSIRAAPLDEFRRRSGQHSLAPRTEDAVPTAGQKRHVEEPCALLGRVVETDPFVGVVG